uniref:DUF4435 domain-containing protein n=1 Tax=Candidatus Kentrum sp. SD TaxID=2126332 RepID=A0A450Y6X1_9GAMM|nr:MAG: hypothetical protein BECKSD772F_GA0070984_101339 [Candidatus Kentron sp. SD]VFK42367.1 MAG: hypothetical protein BECKSD772E_GA0070983_101635 [Candidatus Kentron sp. SD]VFK79441.1 MAG: hypothetical protein BECKSD772D_GA0070982_10507 [Candidatus Kentron sp. SD]
MSVDKNESPWFLAVEGKDERNFFEAMLRQLDIQGVQLVDIGGKDQFKTKFSTLYNLDGFQEVRSLGLIRDAEDKAADAAFSSICSILKKYHLPMPDAPNTVIGGKNQQGKDIRIGIFIMPNNADQGMLEDLCLKSVREERVFSCVEQYMDCCLSALPEDERPRNHAKAKVQTYLAARKEIVNSLGVGAQAGHWEFDHGCFNDIKRFLRTLFNVSEKQSFRNFAS